MGLNLVCVNLFACVQGSMPLDTPPPEKLARTQRTVSHLVAKLEPLIGDDGGRRRKKGLQSNGLVRCMSWKESGEGDIKQGMESEDVKDTGDKNFEGQIRLKRKSRRVRLSSDKKAEVARAHAPKGDNSDGAGGGVVKVMRRRTGEF